MTPEWSALNVKTTTPQIKNSNTERKRHETLGLLPLHPHSDCWTRQPLQKQTNAKSNLSRNSRYVSLRVRRAANWVYQLYRGTVFQNLKPLP